MKNVPLFACAIILTSCVSVREHEFRHPLQSGCSDFPIWETLVRWEEFPLSTASFRLAVAPDTGQGPTSLVVLDSGKLVNLGNPDNAPILIGAVGDQQKTCVLRTPLDDCPNARTVYERLKSETLPLGFGMDDPAEILVLHAPTYYLEFSDGQGNHNQWRFYGLGHPLQTVIDESMESLQRCLTPALDAYRGH